MISNIDEVRRSGGPAFPVYHGGYSRSDNDGLTLRDYFAAKAMDGFLASDQASVTSAEDLARASYVMADAMLKARE